MNSIVPPLLTVAPKSTAPLLTIVVPPARTGITARHAGQGDNLAIDDCRIGDPDVAAYNAAAEILAAF